MGELLSYAINSSVYLAILYIMYKWLMADKNNPDFNRRALLAIYIAALTAPLLPGTGAAANSTTEPAIADGIQHIDTYITTLPKNTGEKYSLSAIAICIYTAGTILALSASLFTYMRLRMLIRGGEKEAMGKYTIVLNSGQKEAPFSWFKYIVLNKTDCNIHNSYILTHEKSHIDHRHWADLALADAFTILQWFNPAAWLIREELKTVHEYQADATVVTTGCDIHEYQMLLIEKAAGARFPSLANSLNHSKLKKRITMMYKSKSDKSHKLLAFAAVPAIVAAYFLTTSPAFASVSEKISETSLTASGNDKVNEKTGHAQIPEQVTTVTFVNTDTTFHSGKYNVDVRTDKKHGIKQTTIVTISKNDPAKTRSKEVKIFATGNNVDDNAILEIDGKTYPKSHMNRLNPDAVKCITVIRENENEPFKIKIETQPGSNTHIWQNDSTPVNAPAKTKVTTITTKGTDGKQ